MSKALLRSLQATALEGRRVVVRADLNVPLDDQGGVADDTRLRASLPTLEYLVGAGARVVLLSHLGRPGGSRVPALSLRPVAAALGALLEGPVGFCPELVGQQADAAVGGVEPGAVLLLENTRFDPGDTAGDADLAARLAAYGDLFVNDAFGTAHRAHASTSGIAHALRERGGLSVAGFLLERELSFLGDALAKPERPFVAVLGGAKISGKIDVVEALLPRVDRLLVGGAMANTFFLAMGLEVGASLVELDRVEVARALLDRAGDRMLLPVDAWVSDRLEAQATATAKPRDGLGPDDRIGDVGPDTLRLFQDEIRGARTVLWNGPLGIFELPPFATGTLALARAVADATDDGALSVIGGGDSAAAAESAGVTERMSHISTGGGASLEFLAGKVLPGVQALTDQEIA